MKKLFSNLLLAVIIFSFLSVLLLPSFASAQVSTPEPGWKGIVPCGRNTGTAEEQAPCTLCHLVVGFQRLVQYGMYMVVTLALVGIFFAGVMYMVSSGDEGMMTQAKGFLKVSLIGFSVVIGAWLIVNVTMWVLGAKEGSDKGGMLGINIESWNKFSCDTKSSQGTGGTPPGGGTKYKCRIGGVCDLASDGIYNSKAECESSPTCKANCSDYHLACNETTPCCDSTQVCAQNPNLPVGKKWCTKPGNEGCGLDQKGTCYPCDWLGCWQTYCLGNFSQDKTGASPCASGNICCVPNG